MSSFKTNLKSTTSTGSGRKMALVVCHKCKATVDMKDTILCSVCTNRYEFNCIGYPEKLYNLTSNEAKTKWSCKSCKIIDKKRDSGKSNITLRKAKNQSSNKNITSKTCTSPKASTYDSIQMLEQIPKFKNTGNKILGENSTQLALSPEKSTSDNNEFRPQENSQSTPHSLSNDSKILEAHLPSENDESGSMDEPLSPSAVMTMSVDGDVRGQIMHQNVQNHELLEKITELMTALSSTGYELENKIIENNELQRKNNQLTMEIKVLKSLCSSTSSDIKNIASIRKKNRHSMAPVTSSSPISPTAAVATLNAEKSLESNSTLITLYQKINDLENMLKKIQIEITTLGDKVKNLANTLQIPVTKYTPNINAIGATEDLAKLAAYRKSISLRKVSHTLLHSKFCVISNYSNHMLKLIRREFDGGNMCFYLSPGAGTRELFDGLLDKLKDFTLNDFCIININDKDFKTSTHYNNLVQFIHERLSLVQHTNIIICSPTYRMGENSNLFNKRIEIFNNLLCKANLEHEFCYLIDSNLHLSYDGEMFTRAGNLNSRGFSTILNDVIHLLSLFILEFKEIHTVQSNSKIVETPVVKSNEIFLDITQE